MRTRLSMILFAAPALLVVGCTGTPNRGLETVHQPVVSRTDYVFDVVTDGGRASPAELQRLIGWMAALRVGYGDRIAVDDPSGTAGGVREQIAGLVARYGLFLEDNAPITAAAMTPGAVRVVVTRAVASVPGCPDYSRNGNAEFEGNTSSNHGCAINSNLAAMVAQPEDLVHGRGAIGATDPVTSSKAVQLLRRTTSSGANGLKSESTGGK